ncbi:MAG: tRNA pseudouridine(55) synthase TruB [Blastocatellia bacterium]
MDGVLIINKPESFTSHDVVARLRQILRTKRIGHTGTLDPFATGVLVMLVGKATRLAQFLDKDDKEYEAVVRFGFETDTGDKTGLRTADCGLRSEEIEERLSSLNWQGVFDHFRGEITQTPPMYSAKKVDGKKLYELARKGVEIEREPVKIVIHKLELIDEHIIRNLQSAIRIRIVCSAGTYIRTLAEDIGRTVGPGAHLEELKRTRAGKFDISESITLADLEKDDDPAKHLIPMSIALGHLPELILTKERIEKTINGLSTRLEQTGLAEGDMVRMIDGEGRLIAIGAYLADAKAVQPKVVLG